MPQNRPAEPEPDRLGPTSTIAELAKSAVLDSLSLGELVVYIRLLGAITTRNRVVEMVNRDLSKDDRTAKRALASLETKGLVKVSRNNKLRARRSIAVLR